MTREGNPFTINKTLVSLEYQAMLARQQNERAKREKIEHSEVGRQLSRKAQEALSTYLHTKETVQYSISDGTIRANTFDEDTSFPITLEDDEHQSQIWLSHYCKPGERSLTLKGCLLGYPDPQVHTLYLFGESSCINSLQAPVGKDTPEMKYVESLLARLQQEATDRLHQDITGTVAATRELLELYGHQLGRGTARATDVILPFDKACGFSLVQNSDKNKKSSTEPIVLRIHRTVPFSGNYEPWVTFTDKGISGAPHSDEVMQENTSKVLFMAMDGLAPILEHYGAEPIPLQGIPKSIWSSV